MNQGVGSISSATEKHPPLIREGHSMSNEEMNKRMEFIIEQQAQLLPIYKSRVKFKLKTRSCCATYPMQ
jgi:hypothetical protein